MAKSNWLTSAGSTITAEEDITNVPITVNGSATTFGIAMTAAAGGGAPVATTGTPAMDGTAALGVAFTAARSDHVHPTDTSRASTATVTSGAAGLAPASGGGAVNYLRADGTWAPPPGAVPSFNTRTGAVTLLSADVTSALAFTPYDAANPSGYQTAAQVALSIANGTAANVSGTVAIANGGTGAVSAFGARTALGVSAIQLGVDFSQGAVVANGTITVVRKATFPFTINSLDYEVGSAGGSFTVAVQIAGTNVTGLSAVTVSSSSSSNAAASAANSVSVGQAVTIVISGVSGSPTGANLQINASR